MITYPTQRASNVPCLIKGNPGGEVVQFGQRMIRITHTVALSYTGAQSGDKAIMAGGLNLLLISIRPQLGVGDIDTWYEWNAGELLPGT